MRAASPRTFGGLLAALAGALALAVPASAAPAPVAAAQVPAPVVQPAPVPAPVPPADGAQPGDSGTVGAAPVITDGGDQTEPAAGDDTPAAPTVDPTAGETPAADPEPRKQGEVHVLGTSQSGGDTSGAAPAASPARTTAAPASARRTLPFTGVNAGLIALIGLTLLASGLATSRAAARAR